jgi:hypothetical protein
MAHGGGFPKRRKTMASKKATKKLSKGKKLQSRKPLSEPSISEIVITK